MNKLALLKIGKRFLNTSSWIQFSTGISQLPIKFLVSAITVTTTSDVSLKIAKNDHGTNSERFHKSRSIRLPREKYKK